MLAILELEVALYCCLFMIVDCWSVDDKLAGIALYFDTPQRLLCWSWSMIIVWLISNAVFYPCTINGHKQSLELRKYAKLLRFEDNYCESVISVFFFPSSDPRPHQPKVSKTGWKLFGSSVFLIRSSWLLILPSPSCDQAINRLRYMFDWDFICLLPKKKKHCLFC